MDQIFFFTRFKISEAGFRILTDRLIYFFPSFIHFPTRYKVLNISSTVENSSQICCSSSCSTCLGTAPKLWCSISYFLENRPISTDVISFVLIYIVILHWI
uniref:(northern house mosquito) hypothetical protein n=1 Tax=Culex pipiens TaxID=7175 RepID=A0A8D8BQ81_CULPI